MPKFAARLAQTGIIVFALGVNWPVNAQTDQTARTIAVTGVGEIQARPDMASIFAGVTTLGDSAEIALSQNSQSMQAIIDGMKSFGIDERDIQTSNFSVSPRYATPNNDLTPAKIIGYQVSNSVSVTVKNIDTLGDALDTFVSVGANNISGIQFGFSDPKDLENQARVEAIRDAKAKAELYATSAGVELGRLMTIQEIGASMPRPFMARGGMAEAMAVPIASGEETISVRINVAYELD